MKNKKVIVIKKKYNKCKQEKKNRGEKTSIKRIRLNYQTRLSSNGSLVVKN
jgi:hypothetical protein